MTSHRPTADPAGTRRAGSPRAGVERVLTVVVLVIIGVALAVNVITAVGDGTGFVGYLAIALAAAGIVVAYRHPYPGLALIAAAAPVAVAGSLVSTGLWSIACFAAFFLALRGASAFVTGGVIAVSNFATAGWEVGTIDVRIDSTASIAAFAAIAGAAVGSSIRGNLRYRREVEQRMRDAEANRATAIDRGIAQERLRIARDLHDSVGHQVAVVNMRLGAAEVHLPAGADVAREDLAAARVGVQAVLRETQQILRVLRVDGNDEVSEFAFRSLGELAASYREAGMMLESSVDELPEHVAPRIRAAVYRIVQEGLTNAHKHGTGTVSLSVAHQADVVRVQLVNLRGGAPLADDTEASEGSASSGTSTITGSGGNGLVGMRERASSVGGTLEVRDDNRLFWLTAAIPTAGGASGSAAEPTAETPGRH